MAWQFSQSRPAAIVDDDGHIICELSGESLERQTVADCIRLADEMHSLLLSVLSVPNHNLPPSLVSSIEDVLNQIG